MLKCIILTDSIFFGNYTSWEFKSKHGVCSEHWEHRYLKPIGGSFEILCSSDGFKFTYFKYEENQSGENAQPVANHCAHFAPTLCQDSE